MAPDDRFSRKTANHLTRDTLILDEGESHLWELFQEGDELAEQDGSPLIESWKRVRARGVNPEGGALSTKIETQSTLRERQGRLDDVLYAARPILNDAAWQMARHGFVVLLADEDGVVVSLEGGGEFASVARNVKLIEGARWGEEDRGTNAIGTALAESRAVTVVGRAHYERLNHSLVCYASPVYDAFGNIIAVLDATSYIDSADIFAQLTVRTAARAIEQAMRLHAYPEVGPGSLKVIDRVLERCAGPALLVEHPGVIRMANQKARFLAGLGFSPQSDGLPFKLQWSLLERLALQGQRSVIRHAGSEFFLNAEPIFDAQQRLWATLVFLEQKQVAQPSAPHADLQRPTVQNPSGEDPFGRIFGYDPVLTSSLQRAALLAPTMLPVLLLAETGTGKDLLAEAIHKASHRADGPLVPVNCGAFSPQLLESELFGYAPGAFTGANRSGSEGRIAAANGGTLFLDEVGEMPPALQAMLLKVLEEGVYYRVGDNKPQRADVRLVCATCKDLPQMVSEGTFRRDLYYRIRGAHLTLPPLRERSDIIDLSKMLLQVLAQKEKIGVAPRLSPEVIEWIKAHLWPGNIRELKMSLHHALVLARSEGVIRMTHLPTPPEDTIGLAPSSTLHHETPYPPPEDSRDVRSVRTRPIRPITASGGSLADMEAEALKRALEEANNNVSEAARSLGVARSTLYRMMRRYGISK